MMSIVEKAAIIHYHRRRIGEYEHGTVGALGYRGEDSQGKRFEVLAAVGDVSGCSVLDVGCGHGDLKGYLDTKFHGYSYVGIDMVPEFVAEARSLYGQRPSCYFCLADFAEAELPRADYVFACGVFAYRCASADFHLAMVERMYAAAGKAFAFNMLDAAVFPEHPLLAGHDAQRVVEFCERLSPRVELVRGYLEDDFTVLMYR